MKFPYGVVFWIIFSLKCVETSRKQFIIFFFLISCFSLFSSLVLMAVSELDMKD